ncbi:MAG: insulinase family protein, partial [Planctomycetes bacterium]|nr:insulinase family protein [Planctomycetota bacterium]
PDWTTIELTGPVEEFDVLLDRTREMLFHAAFPSDALVRERDAVRREQLSADDSPWDRAFWLAQTTLFGDHPYGRHVLGLARGDGLLAITRTDLLRHHRRHFTPSNMTLVVAADIGVDEGIARVRETFGGYRRSDPPDRDLPPVDPLPELRTSFEERDLDGITYLVITFLGPPADHPDRLPLEVLLAALGDSRESILHRTMVIERGLASGVWARLYPRAGPSVAAIGVALPASRIRSALDEIRRQLEIVGQYGPGDAFEPARSRRRSSFTFQYQKSLDWARGMAEADAIGDGQTFLDYRDRLQAVQAADMPAVARRYLSMKRAAVGGVVPRGTPSSQYAFPRGSPLVREVGRDPLPGEFAVVAETLPGADLVAAEVRIRGGSAADPPEFAGIAGLVARLVLRGAVDLAGDAFVRKLESLGARAEAGANRDASFIRFAAPAIRFPDALSAIARAIQRPAFVEVSGGRDIEIVRREIEGESLLEMSRGAGVADRIFWANAFAGTPYEASPLGREESLGAIDRDVAAAYWRSHYRRDRMAVVAAGPVPVRELETLVRLAFRDVPGAVDEPGTWPDEPLPFAAPRRLGSPYRPVDRGEDQMTIVVAFTLPPADPETFPRISLLAHLLGGSPETPLWTLREEYGLAYALGADRTQNRYGGCLRVRALVPEDRAEEALRAMRDAIYGLRERGIAEADLARFKRTFLSEWGQACEDPQYRVRYGADFVYLGWPAVYAADLPRSVEAIGTQDLARTFRDILDPQREWIVAIGRDAVRRFGRPPAPPPPAGP